MAPSERNNYSWLTKRHQEEESGSKEKNSNTKKKYKNLSSKANPKWRKK